MHPVDVAVLRHFRRPMIEALALLALGYVLGASVGWPHRWTPRRTVIDSAHIAMALYGRKRGR